MSATVDTEGGRTIPLYWPVQANRNAGLGGLFVVVLLFVITYGVLFPGLFTLSGFAKFTQSWFSLALVAMAQALQMLTGASAWRSAPPSALAR
jgi:ribose transport system permease protein